MALIKRVSITPDRIVVMAPGKDADRDGLDDRVFDSDAASVGLAIRGEYVARTRSDGHSLQPRDKQRIIFADEARSYDRPPIVRLGYVDAKADRLIPSYCYMSGNNDVYDAFGNVDDWVNAIVTSTYMDIRPFVTRESYPGGLGWPGSILRDRPRALPLHGTMSSYRIKWLVIA